MQKDVLVQLPQASEVPHHVVERVKQHHQPKSSRQGEHDPAEQDMLPECSWVALTWVWWLGKSEEIAMWTTTVLRCPHQIHDQLGCSLVPNNCWRLLKIVDGFGALVPNYCWRLLEIIDKSLNSEVKRKLRIWKIMGDSPRLFSLKFSHVRNIQTYKMQDCQRSQVVNRAKAKL